ncbi:MAG: ComEA family DNA-binding protein [Candidatus Marinimicrobia bacterium]|nr:ComEA family DNA-binding protein [Candidatus Neomarinimicrobiota bacterium]
MIFTKQERNIIFFVVFALLIGLVWLVIKKFILQQPVDNSVLKNTEETLSQDNDEQKDKFEHNQTTPVAEEEAIEKLNINTATSKEIESLPYLGKFKAEAIVNYRKKNGKFQNIHDLVNVSGIGEKLIVKLSIYITI